MKQFLDFVSLMVFFIIYKLYDIFYASGAMIFTSALVIFYTWLRYRRIENVAIIMFVLVAIFGSLTLYYHNAEFIKWKVTIIYVLFALVLLISQFVFGKTLIQKMLDKEIYLPARVWGNLNIAWAIFFLICGGVNIYIAFLLPQSVWVHFKVFGLTGLTLIFTLFNGIYLYLHMAK